MSWKRLFSTLVISALVIGTLGLSGCIMPWEETGHLTMTARMSAGDDDIEVDVEKSPSTAESLGWMSGGQQGLDTMQEKNRDLNEEMDAYSRWDRLDEFYSGDSSESYSNLYSRDMAGYDGVVDGDGFYVASRDYSEEYQSAMSAMGDTMALDAEAFSGNGGLNAVGQFDEVISEGASDGLVFTEDGAMYKDMDEVDFSGDNEFAFTVYDFELDAALRVPDEEDGTWKMPILVTDDYDVRVEKQVGDTDMWQEVEDAETVAVPIFTDGDYASLDPRTFDFELTVQEPNNDYGSIYVDGNELTSSDDFGVVGDNYSYGEEVTLRAEPDDDDSSNHYNFLEWVNNNRANLSYDNDVVDRTTDRNITITMTNDYEYIPIFEDQPREYSVSYDYNDDRGSISASEGDPFAYGDNITFTADPDSGYKVDEWVGVGSRVGYVGDNIGTIDINMSDIPDVYDYIPESFTLGVDFVEDDEDVDDDKYTLSVGSIGDGEVEVSPELNYYEHGEEVTLRAVSGGDSEFRRWMRGAYPYPSPVDTGSSEISFEMTSDYSMRALFKPILIDPPDPKPPEPPYEPKPIDSVVDNVGNYAGNPSYISPMSDSDDVEYGDSYPVRMMVFTTMPRDIDSDAIGDQYRLFLDGFAVQELEVPAGTDGIEDLFDEMSDTDVDNEKNVRSDLASSYADMFGGDEDDHETVVDNVYNCAMMLFGSVSALSSYDDLDGVGFDEDVWTDSSVIDSIVSSIESRRVLRKYSAIAELSQMDYNTYDLLDRDDYNNTYDSLVQEGEVMKFDISGMLAVERYAYVEVNEDGYVEIYEGGGRPLGGSENRDLYAESDDTIVDDPVGVLSWTTKEVDNMISSDKYELFASGKSSSSIVSNFVDGYMSDTVDSFEDEMSSGYLLDEILEDGQMVYKDLVSNDLYHTDYGDVRYLDMPLKTGLISGVSSAEFSFSTFVVPNTYAWDRYQVEINRYTDIIGDELYDLASDENFDRWDEISTWNNEYGDGSTLIDKMFYEYGICIDDLVVHSDSFNNTDGLTIVGFLRNDLSREYDDDRGAYVRDGHFNEFSDLRGSISGLYQDNSFSMSFSSNVYKSYTFDYEFEYGELGSTSVVAPRRVFESDLVEMSLGELDNGDYVVDDSYVDVNEEFEGFFVDLRVNGDSDVADSVSVEFNALTPERYETETIYDFELKNFNGSARIPVKYEGSGTYLFDAVVTGYDDSGESSVVASDLDDPYSDTKVVDMDLDEMMNSGVRLESAFPDLYDVLVNPNATLQDVYLGMGDNVDEWREHDLDYEEGTYTVRLKVRDLEDGRYIPSDIYTTDNEDSAHVSYGTSHSVAFGFMYVRGREYDGVIEILDPNGDVYKEIDVESFSFDPESQMGDEIGMNVVLIDMKEFIFDFGRWW